MACNCAVGICRRSNTQFSAEETPSGGLSFVRLTGRCHSLHATRAQHGASGFVLAVHRNLSHRALCESGIRRLACSENRFRMAALNGSALRVPQHH
jgi:hypothetical protein